MVSASGSSAPWAAVDELLRVLVAAPLLAHPAAREAHQRGLQHPVRLPQLGVGDAVDARPHVRIGEVIAPVGADVLGVEILHRGREPGADVDAVRDVADRDLVLAVVGPQHLPRLARDAPVQRRHAVRVARHLERQHRHAQRLAVILGADPAEAQELVLRQPQRAPQRLEVIVDQLGREAIVAGVDRRVGGEHRALRDLLGAGPEVRAGQLHEQAGVLEGREGAVPLVEVQAPPVDAGGAQRAHAAHARAAAPGGCGCAGRRSRGGRRAGGSPRSCRRRRCRAAAACCGRPRSPRPSRAASRATAAPRRRSACRRGSAPAARAAAPRASGRTRRAASRRGRCAGGSTTPGRRGPPPPAAGRGRTRS